MRFWFLSLLFFMASCGCGSKQQTSVVKIAVDSSWSPLNFEDLEPYVNGYVSEVISEISSSHLIPVETITTRWEDLLSGLQEGKYELALGSLPPYEFNRAKYEFSDSLLDLGPVLIVHKGSSVQTLNELNGHLVGVISGDPAVLSLEKYPEVIIRNYHRESDLLDAVVKGDLDAAILDKLVANSYIRQIYSSELKVASNPLNDLGIRFFSLKGSKSKVIQEVNKALSEMKKDKSLDHLQKKWNL
jgi:ABC-type amino acid transport substrate-binding protein